MPARRRPEPIADGMPSPDGSTNVPSTDVEADDRRARPSAAATPTIAAPTIAAARTGVGEWRADRRPEGEETPSRPARTARSARREPSPIAAARRAARRPPRRRSAPRNARCSPRRRCGSARATSASTSAQVKYGGDRIRHADLDAYLLYSGGAARGGGAAARQDEDVKVVGLRRRIAENMQEAKRRIPHFTYVDEVDVTALEQTRAMMNADRGDNPKLTLLPFLITAHVPGAARLSADQRALRRRGRRRPPLGRGPHGHGDPDRQRPRRAGDPQRRGPRRLGPRRARSSASPRRPAPARRAATNCPARPSPSPASARWAASSRRR